MSKAIWYVAVGFVMLCSSLAAIRLISRQADVGQSRIPTNNPSSRPVESVKNSRLVIEPRQAYQRVFEETTSLPFKFRVTNTSNKTIELRYVLPGCGCTAARMDTYRLAPRQSTNLHVIYNVHGLFGELPRREIRLITDDLDQPVSKCTVSGYRQRRFKINPPSADFGSVLSGEPRFLEVSVQTVGTNMQLLLEKIMVDSPWLTVQVLEEVTFPDDTTMLTLKIGLKKETPQGSIHSRVFIPRVQDDGTGPVIPVIAEVCGPVRMVPPKVFVGILSTDAVMTRNVEVKPAVATISKKRPKMVLVDGFGESPNGIDLARDKQNPACIGITVTASEMELGQFNHNLVIKCAVDTVPYEALLSVFGVVVE
ncbi:MAG: DUF1573 domain-containing protein [Planctomycetes bacterium]|nr:DUF1573 domain-containing protein [Planctomycetota bacterium]